MALDGLDGGLRALRRGDFLYHIAPVLTSLLFPKALAIRTLRYMRYQTEDFA
jgi:hypothetical protein